MVQDFFKSVSSLFKKWSEFTWSEFTSTLQLEYVTVTRLQDLKSGFYHSTDRGTTHRTPYDFQSTEVTVIRRKRRDMRPTPDIYTVDDESDTIVICIQYTPSTKAAGTIFSQGGGGGVRNKYNLSTKY